MLGKAASVVLLTAAAFACSTDYRIWIPRSPDADPLYRFVKNGKAGYINATGRVVIPPSLPKWGNYGSEFQSGLLEIAVSDGKYVDRSGKVVVDPGLYRGWDFSEGLAAAMGKDDRLWGFIDTTGKFAISPRFEYGGIDPFSDGLARIRSNGKVGYIDRTGEFVIPRQFLDGIGFTNGAARVVTTGPCVYFPERPCASPVYPGGEGDGDPPRCKFTFIDKAGRLLTPAQFDGARNFSEDLAPVQIGKLWGFIDRTGYLVVAPKFEDAEPHHSGLSRIKENGLYGYADKTGKVVIPAQFKYAENFSEGFAVIGGYTYIDTAGKRAPFGTFEAASPFFKGIAHVKPRDTTGAYIDKTGRRIFTY